METLLEQIKAAVASDATPDARAAGAQACRTILAALDANVGETLATPPPGAAPKLSADAIHAAVAALRGVPVDQLLDLAIARLRSALPPGAEAAPTKAPTFTLVPVPMARP